MWGYELIVQRGINWRHGAVCFTTEEEILEVNASQNLQPTQRKTSADSLIASFYYFFAFMPSPYLSPFSSNMEKQQAFPFTRLSPLSV